MVDEKVTDSEKKEVDKAFLEPGSWDNLIEFREKEQTIEVPYVDKLYKVTYKICSWGRMNQISNECMREVGPKGDRWAYERKKQEELLKAMVIEIAGVKMDANNWQRLPFAFGENLRITFFMDTGEYADQLKKSGVDERVISDMLSNLKDGILTKEAERVKN